MFGNLSNLTNMLKQLPQLKQNMANMQEELAARTFEAEAGAGLVKAVVNGRSELVDIKIDAEALKDAELLEELIKGAVGAATRKAHAAMKEQLTKLTGGIAGLDQMLNP